MWRETERISRQGAVVSNLLVASLLLVHLIPAQINLNDFCTCFPELLALIQYHYPAALFLQETHLSSSHVVLWPKVKTIWTVMRSAKKLSLLLYITFSLHDRLSLAN
jgi:hypothetical protein